jgi:DNA-binding LacI/PurR family transcriptional regulator
MGKTQIEPRMTKHRQIVEYLRESVVSGTYKPGDQLPTEEELVLLFEASRPTISKAMGELRQDGMIERRAGSGTFVTQHPTQKRGELGLLIPGLGTTEIFEPICAELAGRCQQIGFNLMWGNSTPANGSHPIEQTELLCQHYIDQKVAGVFFAPIELDAAMNEANRRVAERLRNAGIAVVLLDRDIVAYPQRSNFDLVAIDSRRAGFVLTQHLAQAGCEEIHFLARPFSAPSVDARIAGYREALLDLSMPIRSSFIHRAEANDEAIVKKLSRKGGRRGVICANDATAALLMHALDEGGIDVPQQVCVVGIDDVKYAQLLRVPLTTWRQPCADIGRAAFSAMQERLHSPHEAPREILLNGELVERSSSRPKK